MSVRAWIDEAVARRLVGVGENHVHEGSGTLYVRALPESEGRMGITTYEARMLVAALRWGDPALADPPDDDLEALKVRLQNLAASGEEDQR